MPDGRFRIVPSASEVTDYLALNSRTFPNGRNVLSVSMVGIWSCTMTRQPFEIWSRGVLCNFAENIDYFRVIDGPRKDTIVDAARIVQIASHSAGRRARVMIDFTMSAIIAAEVERQVNERLLAIANQTNQEARGYSV